MKDIQFISKEQDYTFVKAWYDHADASHFWMQWRLAAFLNQVKVSGIVHLDQPLRGLEIGCGHGVLSQQIEAVTSWTVDGVDIDIGALKLNKAGKGNLYYYNILEKHDAFKEKFDFLILYDVLEHIMDPTVFLEACLFHLKKGAPFFISVPAFTFLFSAYDVAAGHLRRYDKHSLRKELETAGLNLKVIDLRYWGCLLVPLLIMRKITLSGNQAQDHIIKKGFRPPSGAVNRLLLCLMRIETALLKSPPCGSSVMALCIKQ